MCICTGVLTALIPWASGTMRLVSEVIKWPELLSSSNQWLSVLQDRAAGCFQNNSITKMITCYITHPPPPKRSKPASLRRQDEDHLHCPTVAKGQVTFITRNVQLNKYNGRFKRKAECRMKAVAFHLNGEG